MRIDLRKAVKRIMGGSLAAVCAATCSTATVEAQQPMSDYYGQQTLVGTAPATPAPEPQALGHSEGVGLSEGVGAQLNLNDHGTCGSCSMAVSDCCCSPWWAHRTGVWGELLFLRPGSTDLTYAVEQDSIVAGSFPTGPVGIAGIDEELGFRVGFSVAHSDCTSLVGSYSRWDGDTESTLQANPGNVLNSEIIHPSTATTGATALSAAASQEMSFQLADIGYRHLIRSSATTALNWTAGLRYGNLEQQMRAAQTNSVITGLTTVDTDIDFDGFGLMLGLDGERRSSRSGLLCYGRGQTSLLAGEWDANYTQVNQFGGGVVANQIEDFRVSPVLELEIGLGWQSRCGRVRATTGWMTSAWYDSLSTRSYVDAVRSGATGNIGETVTFTGLTSRVELRF